MKLARSGSTTNGACGPTSMATEDAPTPDRWAGSGCTAASEQITTAYLPFQAELCTQLIALKRALVPP